MVRALSWQFVSEHVLLLAKTFGIVVSDWSSCYSTSVHNILLSSLLKCLRAFTMLFISKEVFFWTSSTLLFYLKYSQHHHNKTRYYRWLHNIYFSLHFHVLAHSFLNLHIENALKNFCRVHFSYQLSFIITFLINFIF